jgi:hypothetical protein
MGILGTAKSDYTVPLYMCQSGTVPLNRLAVLMT